MGFFSRTAFAAVVSAGFTAFGPVPAVAATVSGSQGLALGVVVAAHSPLLSSTKETLERLFEGSPVPGATIVVRAARIDCRTGNVDLTLHRCMLTFGGSPVSIVGRPANELSATMLEAGIPSQGAAGTSFVGLSSLVCTIDTRVLVRKDGDPMGASCRYRV
jgi:hypothetical protein